MTYLILPLYGVDPDAEDEFMDPLDEFLESGVIGTTTYDRISLDGSYVFEGLLVRFENTTEAMAAKLAVPELTDFESYRNYAIGRWSKMLKRFQHDDFEEEREHLEERIGELQALKLEDVA